MQTLFTIGYEKALPAAVLGELKRAKIDLLVDTRAVAASRRPGFSKRQLAASLDEAGIAYLHLQKLGTPAEGRQAARSGDFDTLWRIYDKHIKTRGSASGARRIAGADQVGQTRLSVVLRARPEGMPPQPHRRAGEKAHARQGRGPDPAVVLIIPPAAAPICSLSMSDDQEHEPSTATRNIASAMPAIGRQHQRQSRRCSCRQRDHADGDAGD